MRIWKRRAGRRGVIVEGEAWPRRTLARRRVVRRPIAARGPGRADPASVQARVICDIILVRILFAMGRPARAGMENVRPTI